MAAGGVVALELIVDFGRGSKRFLQEVCPHKRRWPVHLVEILNFLRDVKERSVVIQFLTAEFLAKYGSQFLKGHRLERTRVEQRCGLVLHIRTHIVPLFRNLILAEIGFVRDFLFHSFKSL